MPFLALADVRQTTCHPPSPPRALQFGIIPTCQVFLFPTFHSSMQGVERLSQETRVPLCRIGGKCAAFRAKTVEVSGHLPTSKRPIRSIRRSRKREASAMLKIFPTPIARFAARGIVKISPAKFQNLHFKYTRLL